MRLVASLSRSGRALAALGVGAVAALVLVPHHAPPWVVAFLIVLLGVSALFRAVVRAVRIGDVSGTQLIEGQPGTVTVAVQHGRGRTPFALALELRGEQLQAGPVLHHPPLSGRSTCALAVHGLRRGHASRLTVELRTTAPFGLLHHRQVRTVPCDLWVLPAGRTLRESVLEQLLELRPRGQERPQPVGPGDSEFHSLREFRPGDPERRVHFRATARRGQKVLRVLRGEAPPKVRMVLDLRVGAAQDSFGGHDFEESVRLVAGVTASLVRRQVPLSLEVLDPSGCHGLVEAGNADLGQYLRALALVRPVESRPDAPVPPLPPASTPDERRLLVHQGQAVGLPLDGSWILLQSGSREYWNLLQPQFRFHGGSHG